LILGTVITGFEIAPDKFLVKIGKEKNLTLLDRKSRKIWSQALKYLNEHCCELKEPS